MKKINTTLSRYLFGASKIRFGGLKSYKKNSEPDLKYHNRFYINSMKNIFTATDYNFTVMKKLF